MSLTAPKPLIRPSDEAIQQEVAVSLSIHEQYTTNHPGETYEQGVAAALLWVLGNGELPNGEATGWMN